MESVQSTKGSLDREAQLVVVPKPNYSTNGPSIVANIAPSIANLSRSQQQSSGIVVAPANTNDAPRQSFDSQQTRVAQDRLNAERRQLEQQKAAGRDEVVPLDEFTVVRNVGGLDVRLRIHDEDITSIEVWINYLRPIRFTKQKGITGSQTDEALIYSNGRARLYYVWEISGTLNHCLLRVRDN